MYLVLERFKAILAGMFLLWVDYCARSFAWYNGVFNPLGFFILILYFIHLIVPILIFMVLISKFIREKTLNYNLLLVLIITSLGMFIFNDGNFKNKIKPIANQRMEELGSQIVDYKIMYGSYPSKLSELGVRKKYAFPFNPILRYYYHSDGKDFELILGDSWMGVKYDIECACLQFIDI